MREQEQIVYETEGFGFTSFTLTVPLIQTTLNRFFSYLFIFLYQLIYLCHPLVRTGRGNLVLSGRPGGRVMWECGTVQLEEVYVKTSVEVIRVPESVPRDHGCFNSSVKILILDGVVPGLVRNVVIEEISRSNREEKKRSD